MDMAPAPKWRYSPAGVSVDEPFVHRPGSASLRSSTAGFEAVRVALGRATIPGCTGWHTRHPSMTPWNLAEMNTESWTSTTC